MCSAREKKNAAADSGIGVLGKVELSALLAKEQVAEHFGVSPRTVGARRSTKTGPVPIKIGKRLRWMADSICDYISRQSAAQAKEGAGRTRQDLNSRGWQGIPKGRGHHVHHIPGAE